MTIGQPLHGPQRAAAVAFGLLVAALVLPGCGKGGAESADLYVYVGGTMRPAMEELARRYQDQTGLTLHLDYGGSGENMIKVETTGRGDLYVAHDPFHGGMVRKGLAEEAWHVATIRPVIAVAKGNPKNIRGLKDLARDGVRLVLTHPQYSTTGHIVEVMFEKAGIADTVKDNIQTRTRGGGEAANQVVLGHADAAIVWDAVVAARQDKLDPVDVAPEHRPHPEIDAVTSATFGPIDMSTIRVTVDLLTASTRPERAQKFAEFVAGDEAAEVWKAYGFTLPTGPRHLGAEKASGETKGD